MQNYDDHSKTYYEPGKIWFEEYSLNGQCHRLDGPAVIWYYKSGIVQREHYYLHGKAHRDDGPAIIFYTTSGDTFDEDYYLEGRYVALKYFTRLMRESNNKTETLCYILKRINNYESKKIIATMVINMFRNDIDQHVVDNIRLFL